jgi:hypothetical protein
MMPDLIVPAHRPFGLVRGTKLSRPETEHVAALCCEFLRRGEAVSQEEAAREIRHIVGLDLAFIQGEISLNDNAAAWVSRVSGRRQNIKSARKWLRNWMQQAYLVLEARLP